jgi:bifunctional non-homologous end joining protein LigD
MPLNEYRKKRRFTTTPEPQGKETSSKKTGSPLIYVTHKHRASRLHYDFRLEWKGVLLSWAVPKGPSLDPSVKRLAVKVEDHPIEYAKFEGVIPEGEYGGGTVMLWDIGTWEPEQDDVDEALRKGDFKFTLHGHKLKGSWVLVRTRGYGNSAGRSSWLLIKHRDQFCSIEDVTETKPYSASTQRLLADIARDGGGDTEKAASGDPVARSGTSRRPKFVPPRLRKRRETP